MNIWAMCIKPNCEPDVHAAFDWCQKNGYVGIGGPLNRDPTSEADALVAYREAWRRLDRGVRPFVNEMAPDDFAFLQKDGVYYCCKILGEWKALKVGDERRNGLNLGHLREAKWVEVPMVMVPGSALRAMIRGGACRRVGGYEHIISDVSSLYEYYAVSSAIPSSAPIHKEVLVRRLEKMESSAFFSLANCEETEDMVCTFLQGQGWRLQKSTASRCQPKIECEFLRVDAGTLSVAAIQVKAGRKESIDVSSFGDVIERYSKVYLFSTASPPYINVPHPLPENLELLERSTIYDHYKRNPLELSRSLQLKLTF